MPRGKKNSYTGKQKRVASKISKGAKKKKGRSTKATEGVAWANVSKQTGDGKQKPSSE